MEADKEKEDSMGSLGVRKRTPQSAPHSRKILIIGGNRAGPGAEVDEATREPRTARSARVGYPVALDLRSTQEYSDGSRAEGWQREAQQKRDFIWESTGW